MLKKFSIKYKLVLVLSFTLFLMGCSRDFEYVGEHPELFSVAVNSVLGVRGYLPGHMNQPNITVVDRDGYGRILFSYDEGHDVGDDSLLSGFNYVIVQKVEGDYAYFYPHYNFISGFDSGHFTGEEMAALREVNSWNQEMSDSSEFVRVRVVRQKEEGPISDNELVEMHHLIFPDLNFSRGQIIPNVVFLRIDGYGRSVYLVSRGGTGTHIAALFQPDHSFDVDTGILEIEDLTNYQTELRLFMEANGWDTPFDD